MLSASSIRISLSSDGLYPALVDMYNIAASLSGRLGSDLDSELNTALIRCISFSVFASSARLAPAMSKIMLAASVM